MAKVKFDSKQVKQFLIDKGEWVGLGVAVAVLVLLLGYTVAASFIGSRSQHKQIAKSAEDLRARINSATPTEEGMPALVKEGGIIRDWDPVKVDPRRGNVLSDNSVIAEAKRVEPRILPLDTLFGEEAGEDEDRKDKRQVRSIQVDVIPAGVVMYDVRLKGGVKGETIGVLDGRADVGAPGGTTGRAGVGPTPAGIGAGTGVYGYGGSAESGLPGNAVLDLKPARLVVVNATFSYDEQVKIYKKALRIEKDEELFARGLQPTFAGLIVLRREITYNKEGKPEASKWQAIYSRDPKQAKKGDRLFDGTQVAKEVRDLLTRTRLDQYSYTKLASVLAPGGATPLPTLASGKYPTIHLTGIPIVEETTTSTESSSGEGPKSTIGGKQRDPGKEYTGPDAPYLIGPLGSKITHMTFEQLKLPPQVVRRLRGKDDAMNWFHPLGTQWDPTAEPKYSYPGVPTKEPGGGKPARPPGADGEGEPPGPGGEGALTMPTEKAFTSIPVDKKALLRFVDVVHKTGVKYEYAIKVRMHNPNYQAKTEVAMPSLAENDELLSREWVQIQVDIPPDYQFYVINQQPLATPQAFTAQIKGGIDRLRNPPADKAVIQVHRWVGRADDDETRDVGDWVIAERLFIGRGDYLGREDVVVELPVWNRMKSSYEMAHSSTKLKSGKVVTKGVGVPVDFLPKFPPDRSICVDFVGGPTPLEESSQEMLVLQPDGSLIVRNSRDDSYDYGWNRRELTEHQGNQQAQERRARYEDWVRRLDILRHQLDQSQPKTPGGDPGGTGGVP